MLRKTSSLVWCAWMPLVAAPIMAQSSGAASGGDLLQLEEVTVTAQRRVERLQDVPMSATVVSGDSLERANIRSLTDLANHQPNFQIQQAPGGDQLAIRGTGSGANSGFEQSVGTFVDGLYRGRARSTRIALFDVERVEVLKGPQTIFFGANAIAGALNITTRKGTNQFEANSSALYSPSDGEYNVEAGVGGPLGPISKLRLAARLSGMNGYIDNDKLGGKGPRARDGQVRLSANFRPVDLLTVDARLDYARFRDAQSFDAEIVSCPPTTGTPGAYCALSLSRNGGRIDDTLNYHSAASASYSNIDLYEGQLTARFDLGPVSLISTSGYFDQKWIGQNDLNPFPGNNPLGDTADYGSLADKYKQYSEELRLESTSAGRVRFIGGAYFEHGDLNLYTVSASYSRIPSLGSSAALQAVGYNALSPVGYVRSSSQSSRTISGFGSVDVAVTEPLHVVGSLRYSDVRKTASNINVVYGLVSPNGDLDSFIQGNAAQQTALRTVFALGTVYPFNQRSDSGYMPGATLRYNFGPDVMGYVSYSRGFKAGGFSGPTNVTFEPEHATTYEVGLKSSSFNRRMQLNIATFETHYSNLQETQFVVLPGAVTSTSLVTNVAESKSRGVEVSAVARITSRLTASSDLAYLDSHYVRYPNGPCYAGQTAAQGCAPASSASGQGQTLDGRTRPFAPTWSGNLDADCTLPLRSALEWRLGATVYFKSSYLVAPSLSPYSEQRAYAKLDLRATLLQASDSRWEVGLVAKNVLDKKTIAFFDDVPVNVGSFVALADRPRSVALTGSYRF
jgi:iron complex outermembrane receptor protein